MGHNVEPTPKATCAMDIMKKVNEHGLVGYCYGGDEHDLPFLRECEDKGWLTWAYDMPPDPLLDKNRDFGRFSRHRSIFSITLAGRQALYLFTETEGAAG